jgi:hypothetical protein
MPPCGVSDGGLHHSALDVPAFAAICFGGIG